MTLSEMTAAMTAHWGPEFLSGFLGSDKYACFYGITDSEAERIAAKSTSVDEFEGIYMNEFWWPDPDDE